MHVRFCQLSGGGHPLRTAYGRALLGGGGNSRPLIERGIVTFFRASDPSHARTVICALDEQLAAPVMIS
jgi:hypothetical protein